MNVQQVTDERLELFYQVVEGKQKMNEQIDNLLWQAGGYTKLNYPNDTFLDGRYALTQLQLEKFAELLIKECADVGNNAYSDVGNYTYIGDKIKEHFGVEE